MVIKNDKKVRKLRKKYSNVMKSIQPPWALIYTSIGVRRSLQIKYTDGLEHRFSNMFSGNPRISLVFLDSAVLFFFCKQDQCNSQVLLWGLN